MHNYSQDQGLLESLASGRASRKDVAVERAAAALLLERFHAAQGAFYAGGDEGPVRELLTDDVVWHVPGPNAIAGDYHGIDAVVAYFASRRELARRTFRMHPRDVLVGDGDDVAVITDGRALIRGVERVWSTVGLYRFRGQQIAVCWLLPLDADAFNAIWSSPSTPGSRLFEE